MSTLFPRPGSVGTPTNPIVVREGRKVDSTEVKKVEKKIVAKKIPKVTRSENKIVKKFVNSRLSNRTVVKKSNIAIDIRRMGF